MLASVRPDFTWRAAHAREERPVSKVTLRMHEALVQMGEFPEIA
jgi:hypothetical protein